MRSFANAKPERHREFGLVCHHRRRRVPIAGRSERSEHRLFANRNTACWCVTTSRTGQELVLQPLEGKGEPPLRWNWDSPLIISPHSHTRLYFAANELFRSDDRGDTWKAISGDLTRQIDRNKLPVMGKVWGPDAVAKNQSTSFYGNIVSLAESPKREGLIYVGTDDGLIQVTNDGGGTWTKYDKFAGVPDTTYVSRLAGVES